MPAKSVMDGSDGSLPRYTHGHLQRSQQQSHSQERSSQPAGGSYQQGEREPLLGRTPDPGMESGLPRDRNPILPISASNVTYLLAGLAVLFLYLGYTLHPITNTIYHEAVRQAWNIEKRYHWRQREKWTTEVAKHQALRLQMNHDEAVWEERRARREEQEKQRYDEEVKKREGISWESLVAARCSRYGTREYTAVLAHIPLGFDALEECRKKTVNIHGRDLLPSRCEDQGACGRVIGHWDVDFNEPGCITWWHWFDDKGCYSSGVRLYHSKLEHLEDYDLWPVMCSTTPRVVQGVHYDGPTSCADFGQGPWGIWHIPDGSCY